MHILILHTSSDMYGASKILLIVIEILKKRNNHITVVLSEEGPLVEVIQKMGIAVYIIRLGILRRKYFNFPGLLNRIKVLFKAWKRLSQFIDDKKPDIIYSNTTGVLVGALLAKAKGIKHIWHVHEIIIKPVAFTKIIGFFLNSLSSKVIVVSDAVKKHWLHAVNEAKMIRIYNGIDSAPFKDCSSSLRKEIGVSNEVVVIGMIGRINHWKGQSYFLEIARKLHQNYPFLCFVLVGDVYPGNEALLTLLNQEIANSGFSNKIFNLNYRTDIVNILNGLDIFILPSIEPDPFPTVILESMCAQKAVVATNHGGAPEMIEDGKSGIIIPINNPLAAANKIASLVENKWLRLEMGVNASKRVQELFSYKTFEKAIENTFII